MNRTIITVLFMLMGMATFAQADYFLTFTKDDRSIVSFPTENIKLTFDNDNVIVNANGRISYLPLAQLQQMQFTTDHEITTPIEDVNQDGEVNIGDVNAVIDMILSGTGNALGDVNGDGEVNIADVNAVIDAILGK